MNEIEKRPFTTVFILTDENGEIYYSNIINTNIARGFLEMLNIKESSCGECSVKKEIYNYIMTADKVIIEGNIFWVVIVETEDSYKPYRDLSTDLYNRNYWEHLKNGFIKLHASFYSLIVVDIDDLKEFNDLYGHKAGDKAITIVGKAIKDSIRENDIPIHYGGDEYIIILPNIGFVIAEKVVERIRNEINRKCISEKIIIEISAGIAGSDDINKLEQIMQSADEKMYMEKRNKKKCMF